MSVLVPWVVEKSGREERVMDIYSRLLQGPDRHHGQPSQ